MRARLIPMLGVLVAACSSDLPVEQPLFSSSALPANLTAEEDAIVSVGDAANVQLEAANADYRVAYAEWLGEDAVGNIVFFNNRGNKQLSADFVPGDPRRGGRTNITYIVDQTEGSVDGLTTAQTTAAIDRAMASWDAIQCSVIPVEGLAPIATDIGIIEFTRGLGGSPAVFADIAHAGWLPAGILPSNVLGVTFTFIWVGGNGPTDIDGNGLRDVAFREILYNDSFVWKINARYDVETVALHEAGHGLSQGHFGKAFLTGNGKIHFAPRAVMNAAYSGVQQSIGETDNAGHCSNWASWPNN